MQRRDLLRAGGALASATVTRGLTTPAIAQDKAQAAAKVLRVIPQANLTSLDPVWTSAVVTRNHAYLVYDQLVAVDADFRPQPQMADGWKVTDKDLTWTFGLREKLMFHDGTPVLARDCVASIKRWWARDSLGQTLAEVTDALDAPDDRSIVFRLKTPFPLLAFALGKATPSPLFIMPERIASTDPYKAITDATGSGPFRFLKDEWNPGSRAAWAKFDRYEPRSEFPDGIAGGRRANVDRVEWTVIPDSTTAANAIINDEQDYWEYPLHDLLPLLQKSKDVVVDQRLAQPFYAGLRMNELQPPFDNVKVRRALLMAVDQKAYMQAVAGEDDQGGKNWGVCEGVFACDGPFKSVAGAQALQTHDIAKAAAALKESGYKGERTVLMAPSDYPSLNALALVTADSMKKMGFNLDVVSMDWGTLIQRRANKGPVDKGGWSVFHSTWSGADVENPAVQVQTRANKDGAWFGWPEDAELETLRDQWMATTDGAKQKDLADAIQVRAFEVVPFIPLGYFWQRSAWRKSVVGTFPCQVTSFWNLGKQA